MFNWLTLTFELQNRHQFYLQAKVDLIEGRLSVTDNVSTIRICALIAQSEMGDSTGMPCQTESYILGFSPQLTVSDIESFQANRDEGISQVLQQHQTLKVCAFSKHIYFRNIRNNTKL